MQIHSVNNTNFKALKISPKLRSELVKSTDRYLKSLDNYGEVMADVKLYNVVFEENMNTPKIFHATKNTTIDYFAELKNEEKYLGKYYERPAGFDGDTVGGFYPDTPRVFRILFGENAKERYGKFKTQDTLTQVCEYSRMLEEAEIKEIRTNAQAKEQQSFAEALNKEAQRKINRAADELIEKYGYEPSKEVVKINDSHKSWWKRLFKNS